MTAPAHDPVSAAFEDAADALDQAPVEASAAARRVRRLRGARASGRRWGDILGRGVARNLLEEIGGLARRMSSAAGRLRRAIVDALLGDGLRVTQIAETLGVSHQRISRVLAHNAEDHPSQPS
jgi:hypothetical protein